MVGPLPDAVVGDREEHGGERPQELIPKEGEGGLAPARDCVMPPEDHPLRRRREFPKGPTVSHVRAPSPGCSPLSLGATGIGARKGALRAAE